MTFATVVQSLGEFLNVGVLAGIGGGVALKLTRSPRPSTSPADLEDPAR